ncbi:MAG: calcium:proton antiporter [Methanocalculus sp. MSAO_Arc1]|uniref:cache domain-containing protein n=1 Tax=Methanocalculus TaxID=71151 RepID=UPI000FEF97D9|nr:MULTISPECIES: cache domain-containing protein [unclassified Methanocalculus]MCP1662621.1 signal transduction histidine kinase [Methanocalculus sp. AMF5]RQD80869.1 MAG: calcium:proton antiporter [Methanocalculus sp. MSAO_Arc1]
MKYWIVGLFLVLLLACAGCVAEEEPVPDDFVSVDSVCPSGEGQYATMTISSLESYMQDAVSYAADAGKEEALAVFGDPDGAFSYGGWYVYAYDDDCILLAHPYETRSVGLNRSDWRDSRGLPVIRIGRDVALAGGGFITYLYPRPSEAGIDEAAYETYEPKLGYVLPAGEGWWIGSGVALTDLSPHEPHPPVVSGMIALVEDGALYALSEGDEAALTEISDLNGRFVNEQGHYLYAYRYDGTLIGHPHLAAKIGMDLSGRECIYGMTVIQSLAEAAGEGGGFVVFIWPNPDEGNREELKIGYVLPVNDEWWLGSGVYLSEVTGEYTPVGGP